jgi:hypothetical protein
VRLQSRLLLAISTLGCFAIFGCGGNTTTTGCKILAINVSPATATADHAAAPPGNTQHFNAFIAKVPPGCSFITGNIFNAVWSVSDPVNVSISNAQDSTRGNATCKAATTGAVTVTATAPAGDGTNVTNTASLTCN